jgi:hypothetical protein
VSDELKPVYALDFPASLGNPWVDAVCEYLVACLSAILLNDWNELVEKYAAMITEQNCYRTRLLRR